MHFRVRMVVYICTSPITVLLKLQMKIRIICLLKNSETHDTHKIHLSSWQWKFVFFFGTCCVISILIRSCLLCVFLNERYQCSDKGSCCNNTSRSLLLSGIYYLYVINRICHWFPFEIKTWGKYDRSRAHELYILIWECAFSISLKCSFEWTDD